MSIPKPDERTPGFFRKKPVKIEAVEVTAENRDDVIAWIGKNARPWNPVNPIYRGICIETLEGVMTANLGDWVIKGVRGEFYPCKPDIFAATYEPTDAVNAYTSTDALRSALANLVNTEALKNVKGLVFSVYRNEPRDREAKIGTYTGALFDLADAIDAARAALSDSPAPKTCRACKGFGCVDDDPEVRGSVTECWKCGGSGFDSPAPSTEGLREALEKIEGGSFPGASTLAINGDWKGIVDQLQSIARTALAGVTAPSEVPDA